MPFLTSSFHRFVHLFCLISFIKAELSPSSPGGAVLDQYQLHGEELWGDSNFPIGQSFTAGVTGLMVKIQLLVCSFGDTLRLHVHQGPGIHGPLLYTGAFTPAFDCTTFWTSDQMSNITGMTDITLIPSIAVTAGSVYTFNIYCDLPNTQYCTPYVLGYTGGDPYHRGDSYSEGEPAKQYDLAFATYVQPAQASPAPPVLASLDQCQLNGGSYYGIYNSPLGQSFTAGITGVMMKIQILVCSYEGTIHLHVHQGAGIHGPLLYTGIFTPIAACLALTYDDPVTEITLNPGIPVIAGSIYTFVCDCANSSATCENFAMGISMTNEYGGGQVYSDTGASNAFDVVFATYVQSDILTPNPSPSFSVSPIPFPSSRPSLSPATSPSVSSVNVHSFSWSRSPKASVSQSRSPRPSKSPKTSMSPSRSPSKSPKASMSESRSSSPSKSPKASMSASRSPSRSKSPKASMSPSRSPSKSPKASMSESRSPNPSKSPKTSMSPSRSPSKSPKASMSGSRSSSPSKSPKASMSASRSPSPSRSPLASMSQSRSPSKSPKASMSASRSPNPSKSPKVSLSQSRRPSPHLTDLSSSPSPIITNDLPTFHFGNVLLHARRGPLTEDSDAAFRAPSFSWRTTVIVAAIAFSVILMAIAMAFIHWSTRKPSTVAQDNLMPSDIL